jgi:phosphoribulokinase
MSARHPIIAITGSSGAGTTSVMRIFDQIFRREGVHAAFVEGDSFHRYNRADMDRALWDELGRGNHHFSHFGPDANLLEDLEALFREYGETGRGQRRRYLHDAEEAEVLGGEPGNFTAWQALPPDTDLLFYEGLHGAFCHGDVDVGRWVDLKVGVVPVLNLEWIQKLHRDAKRGHTAELTTDTILRRMHDYVHYICPQFSRTHVNFQRVPMVDTSNPFIARHVPSPDESMLVIRFADPRGIDFPYLISMLHDSFMSRPNTIVCPGGKMDLAMQLIFTPIVWRLMERRKQALDS